MRSSDLKNGAAAPPATPQRQTVETYHGVSIADPYRWLDDPGASDVRAWIEAQNAHARALLDAWPGRVALRARLTELMAGGSSSYSELREAGGVLFAIKRQPPKEQPLLVTLASPDDLASERVVVDPNVLDPTGATSIDWFEPSHDGANVAVSLSRSGTETGDVHVFETATGRATGEVVPRVNGGTAGGSLAWDRAGSGFYYTRYPRPGERPDGDLPFWVQIYWHPSGKNAGEDRYELGREFPKIAEIRLETSPRTPCVLASVQDGDGGDFQHWLRDEGGAWRIVAGWDDRWAAARLGEDGAVYAVSLKDAPRGAVRHLPGEGGLGAASARVLVPEQKDAIQTSFSHGTGLWIGRDRIYVLYQRGGPNVVKAFGIDGRPLGEITTAPLSAVDAVAPLASGEALVSSQSMTAPPMWLRVPRDGTLPKPTALGETSRADFSGCEVVRDEAVSPDGTRVPMTILRRRGLALDGSHPTMLYGYGGYGVSQTPAFRARLAAWTERGGVFVLAHIRGGGEFGDDWHCEGHRDRKQNVFDDFAACARRLVTAGYATPETLALLGGSNGGLLMGAMITQHPRLCRAVVSLVGLYDMLRVERTPNGAFNVTEFGSVEDPAMFRVLHGYSPYHNVREGTPYPAVLLLAGENDPRVDSWQSSKMAARLQKATSSKRPVLLRTNSATGHGIGTALTHQIEEYADILTFVFRELGL